MQKATTVSDWIFLVRALFSCLKSKQLSRIYECRSFLGNPSSNRYSAIQALPEARAVLFVGILIVGDVVRANFCIIVAQNIRNNIGNSMN
jgi:hypothetical protein